MSIRKRFWHTNGVRKEAWVANYTDPATGKRRLLTFQTQRAAKHFVRLVHAERHVGLVEPLSGRRLVQFTSQIPKTRHNSGRKTVEEALRAAYPTLAPTTDNVIVHVLAFVPPAVLIPDVDNLLKPVIDALSGVLYVDDTQIIECLIRRVPSLERCLRIKVMTVARVDPAAIEAMVLSPQRDTNVDIRQAEPTKSMT
jgi:hypothetical protein